MSDLGVRLTLMAGPSVPVPVSEEVSEALRRVEVTHSDEARSGFQLDFQIGRSGPADLADYGLMRSLALKPYSRIVLTVVFGAVPRVLMDGVITNIETQPANEPGRSKLVVTGEDVSCMMDLDAKPVGHPAQSDAMIALKIIAKYAVYGLTPVVVSPPGTDVPPPTGLIPTQRETDLAYLQEMAERYAYVFYIVPGPAPLTSMAYWGPPVRVGVPQRALTIGMGPDSNVESLNVRLNALAPALVSGRIQDPVTHQVVPVETFASLRPPLAAFPLLLEVGSRVKRTLLPPSADDLPRGYARAQALTEAAQDAVTAEGELDATRYGDLLQARALVGVRGAGYSHDGWWYVKKVTHVIENGSYRQRFSLAREGTGSTTPVVIP
jgi:hypothetical protein